MSLHRVEDAYQPPESPPRAAPIAGRRASGGSAGRLPAVAAEQAAWGEPQRAASPLPPLAGPAGASAGRTGMPPPPPRNPSQQQQQPQPQAPPQRFSGTSHSADEVEEILDSLEDDDLGAAPPPQQQRRRGAGAGAASNRGAAAPPSTAAAAGEDAADVTLGDLETVGSDGATAGRSRTGSDDDDYNVSDDEPRKRGGRRPRAVGGGGGGRGGPGAGDGGGRGGGGAKAAPPPDRDWASGSGPHFLSPTDLDPQPEGTKLSRGGSTARKGGEQRTPRRGAALGCFACLRGKEEAADSGGAG